MPRSPGYHRISYTFEPYESDTKVSHGLDIKFGSLMRMFECTGALAMKKQIEMNFANWNELLDIQAER
jgi:hypothetical protein